MRLYTQQPQFYGGIALPARTMSVCILNHAGELVVHRKLPTSPEALLKTSAPDREHLVSAVECLCTGYWLADLCAREGLPFVRGHALSMPAIHGRKAKNDPSDAHQLAVRLRGGMLPQASVYPAKMRATRALLRRRMQLMRKRAELLTHVQRTNCQYPVPEIGKKIAYQAIRMGVAERVADPAVPTSIAVDLALIDHDDRVLNARELSLRNTAKQPAAHPLYLRQTGSGIGNILSRVLRDAMHDSDRFPRVQDVVSSCRFVNCAKESAGQRDGTSGTKNGQAYLKWACSDAAVLF